MSDKSAIWIIAICIGMLIYLLGIIDGLKIARNIQTEIMCIERYDTASGLSAQECREYFQNHKLPVSPIPNPLYER